MLVKRLLLLVVILSVISKNGFSQKTESYSANWKKVEALEKKGLTASALKEVVGIFELAIASGNDAQQIKSAMYQMKYRNMVDEDNNEKNIFFIDTLIAKAKGASKNILQSMQAQLFLNYQVRYRYKLLRRTQLLQENGKDISTWSMEKFNKTITALYKASLKNDHLLKNISIGNFDVIIEKGENSRNLRPTLYDFLAYKAFGYFTNTEIDVTAASYKFILNDEKIFSPAATFIQSVFTTKDSASHFYSALLVLQDILKFHIADADPAAFLDADITRLSFVNKNGVFTNKDKLYEDALKKVEAAYSNNPYVAQAMYLRALLYKTKGENYNPQNQKEFQFYIKDAKELCEQAINKFPKSEGAINCQALLESIKRPSLDLKTEKVNIPDEAFRSFVQYKNVNTLYLRAIKTSRSQLKDIEKDGYNRSWQAMVNLKATRSWSIDLPNQHDYQYHSTEIKIDGLPKGTYIILASINPDFDFNNNILAREITYISNIAYLYNNKDELYVLDRNNGQPLANAEVQLWQNAYNYDTRIYTDVRSSKYTSDKNGYIKIKKGVENNYNYYFQVKYKDDELYTDDVHYRNSYNSYQKSNFKHDFLFTDRSIYRPGQTLFFKGILINRDSATQKSNTIENEKITVALYDANGQKVSSSQFTSNEYGSFNGSFKLPENGLTGQFFLYDSLNNASKYFNVEEYKRPKFSVEVKKPEGTYRVNDSISVTGIAKAYAGNYINGAKVTYRVVRTIKFPIWWMPGSNWKRGTPFRTSESMEITNGETTTNNKGEFFITFKAIPDELADKKNQPVFYYEVSTDITDTNGETRSGNTSVAVAYQALELNILSEEKMPVDSLHTIKISSKNINGLFEKAFVNLNIQKLKSPDKIFRERYWETPDLFTMTKDEYAKNFPYDAYGDENEVAKWPILEKVIDITDSTSANSTFKIQHSRLNEGWYKIVITTKDKYGEEVKAEKYIKLTNDQQRINDEPIIVSTKSKVAEPGQKISYNITTGFDKIWLIHILSRPNNADNYDYPVISNTNPYTREVSITDNDRGGIGMNYAFIFHNRVYKGSQDFNVAWDNKDLDISYETFRDKILPGSEEKWKLKITGNKAEKVSAEALISMYDASLDQFSQHSWSSFKFMWPLYSNEFTWLASTFVAVNSEEQSNIKANNFAYSKWYDDFLDNGWNDDDYRNVRHMKLPKPVFDDADGDGIVDQLDKEPNTPMASLNVMSVKKSLRRDAAVDEAVLADQVSLDYKSVSDTIVFNFKTGPVQNGGSNVQVRKNFNETAFFFPSLNTDANGNIEFSFTIPEALTSWKMMTLAHTKDLASTYSEKTVITQKPLMVQPNAPRFLREGDRMEFSAKIVNLADSEITGTAQLELFDAVTNKPVDGLFKNMFPVQYFTAAAGQSTSVKFPIDIPFAFNSALTWRIKASSKTGAFSDGEENALPVLTNRMLVTETLPLNMRNETTKNFKFEKLLNSNNSGSLTNHAITVEYTSNPAWYAVQALPYLMEYPYECAEQSFNRYYANALASFVCNSMPKIKSVFEKWKTTDTAALLSNLQKNQELKSALLQETPWVMAAQNENEQKKNIAVLFDMVRLANEKEKTIAKLKEMQTSNGGFSWFKGGRDDRYITQYIITGIGHLRKLNAINNNDYNKLKTIIENALPYLDARLKDEYNDLKKYKANLKSNNLSYSAIQYLYMRSFFPENKISSNTQTAYTYYYKQAQHYWLSNNKYMQAMIALGLYRTGDEKTAHEITNSLKENAIYKEEMGMYFKEFTNGGYYWYQSPIESQAMMIEAFTDIDKNITTVDDLKTWLLKQKQTQNWKTTKATSEACYALLLNGSNWLTEEKEVTVNIGNTTIKSVDENAEAGTGYFKKTIPSDKVQQGMGNITVNIKSSQSQVPPSGSRGTSWGAVYWQYFEDLDKITSSETPLKLVKKLFIEKNSDHGPVLQALNDGDELHIGDKIKVRIELRADRDMEYIHMKDMRAACMEPVNVISEYKWQGGLGYYESTKDASTNFFFGWLPRGTYVFEYPMFVTHAGNFSNGITTIQCMYAPEFMSHSDGIRVSVE
ncbi:MAG: alpha-2-macroglobulin family protein [Ferruginibacter sp.]